LDVFCCDFLHSLSLMSDSDPSRLVTAYVDALDRDDLIEAFALVSDDAVCLIPSSLPLQNAQTKRDYLQVHQGIRRAFPSGLQWHPTSLLVDGLGAVMEIDVRGTHASGRTYRALHCCVFSTREGRITEIHEHFDTLALFKLWLPAEAIDSLSWS